MKRLMVISGLVMMCGLSGCAQPTKMDYSEFNQSKPKSILVLLPENSTPEVQASHGLLAQTALPLAEAGYYVFPVAVVEETFKQNGITNAGDIQSIPPAKLHEIFGNDAVLYLDIAEYGTSYQVISSDTRVTASAKLVDARTGSLLWSGSATASSTENSSSVGGLIGALISAVVNQIVNTMADKSYAIAGITNARLLSAGKLNGILYGPRSPNYGKDTQ